MKKIWAVELDLLNEFSSACSKHNLKWFAHAGTLLGAVRHHGFIPWDDDIDVMMPRADYERLYSIGPDVFSHPYFFQNENTDPFFCRSFSRLRNSNTSAIQVWEKDYAYPYNQGIFIDIFPYDNLPDDEEELKSRIRIMEPLAYKGEKIRNLVYFYRPLRGKGFKKRTRYFLKHVWLKFFDKEGGDYKETLKAYYDMMTAYNTVQTKRVGEVVIPPLNRHIWNREWLDEAVLMPFEMLNIPVPQGYIECLEASFGQDWSKPKRQGSYHGQILFDVDHPYTDFFNKKDR